MSKNAGKIIVKLKMFHPIDQVPARLSDGTIVEVNKKGIVISESLYSQEMRDCQMYDVMAVPVSKKSEEPSDKEEQPSLDIPEKETAKTETAKQRKAREQAEKEAADKKAAEEPAIEQDAQDAVAGD